MAMKDYVSSLFNDWRKHHRYYWHYVRQYREGDTFITMHIAMHKRMMKMYADGIKTAKGWK